MVKNRRSGIKAAAPRVRWSITKIFLRNSADPFPGELDRAHLTMTMKFPVRRRKGGAS